MGEKFYKVEQDLHLDPIEVEADTYTVSEGMLFLNKKSDDANWNGYDTVAIFPKGCWISLIACYRDLQEEHDPPRSNRLPMSI